MAKKALYTGSFDPITNGHLDIITRASKMFDELVVGVIVNPNKTPLFTKEERVEMIKELTADLGNVTVDCFQGLLADYVNANHDLKAVLDLLTSTTLGTRFDDVAKSLLTNAFGTADAYMALADFDSYVKAQELVGKTYQDKYKFMDMSLTNIAKAGIFSSDRAIKEYADNIWKIK